MPPITALARLRDLVRAPPSSPPPVPPERLSRRALCVLVVFVAYGCLYPFVLAPRPRPMLVWPTVPTPGDVVANVAIYALLGFVAFGALSVRRGPAWRVFAVAAAGLALSLAIEIVQAFLAGRYSSALDVAANVFGAVTGAVAAAAFRRAGFRRHLDPGTGIAGAMLLFALWFACRLSPFVVAIDAQHFDRALAPLAGSWRPDPVPVLLLAAYWLAVFAILAVLAPRRHPLLSGLAVALALTSLRLVVRGQLISPLEIQAFALAAFAYGLGLRRPWMLAAVLATAIAVEALQPFAPGPLRAMNLIPFRAFIHGSIEGALQRLLLKCFAYGALAWLLLQAGLRPALAILGGTLAILGLELAQTGIAGRYADVTDPLIHLALAITIRSLDRLDLRHSDARIALGGGGASGLQSRSPGGDA